MELAQEEQSAFAKALEKVFGEAAASGAFSEKTRASGRLSIAEFSAGQTIYENGSAAPALGFIVRGGAEVVRRRAGSEVFLRRIDAGDAFGAARLFSEDSDYVTCVRAYYEPTRVLFMPQTLAEDMMLAYPRAALGYIRFLSEKIRFLNSKMAAFTADGAAAKLAAYIRREADNDGVLTPGMPYRKLAGALGLGHASLYRALDELEEAGAIRKEQKTIFILDRGILSQF